MRLKNKPWARPFLQEHQDLILDGSIFIEQLSKSDKPVYLEIGSGKGQFLLTMASNHPQFYFYGVERALVPVAIAGRKLFENPLDNARFVNADISLLLESIASKRLAGIFLNFSDPWPKKRHAKRRLTALPFLDAYMRILTPGGCLYFKSDNGALYDFTLNNYVKRGYNIISNTTDYDGNDPFDAQSEYEMAFREQGVKIHRIVVRKD
jgi:tRNA (guanine-N7-)-methyltransferase